MLLRIGLICGLLLLSSLSCTRRAAPVGEVSLPAHALLTVLDSVRANPPSITPPPPPGIGNDSQAPRRVDGPLFVDAAPPLSHGRIRLPHEALAAQGIPLCGRCAPGQEPVPFAVTIHEIISESPHRYRIVLQVNQTHRDYRVVAALGTWQASDITDSIALLPDFYCCAQASPPA